MRHSGSGAPILSRTQDLRQTPNFSSCTQQRLFSIAGRKQNFMSNRANPYVAKLTRLASAYREAEAQVVRGFFKKARRTKEHLRWLKAQGFKEYSAIKPIVDALAALYPDIDRGIDRHHYAELTEKLADETKHARLVMDLLQQITGRKITPRDLTWLPQDRALARVRAQYSKSYAGLLQIARVFREILRDEVGHKDTGARALAGLISDEDSFRRAARIIGEVSGQRLRMRNEQFGFPLDRHEVAALDDRIRQLVDKE